MSIWHLPWLLSVCNSPEWVARVQFAAHWEILRGPLRTVDKTAKEEKQMAVSKKRKYGAKFFMDILL